MKAVNIDWDTDEQEATEDVLDYASKKEIADLLGAETYEIENMNEDDLYDFIRDAFHHYPGLMDDYFGLPSSVDIPNNVDEDDIADWLSNIYGSCIRGFDLIK